MRILLRLYVDQLLKGNPLVVIPTAIAAVAVSVGPFYENLSKGDPMAIGLASMVGLGIVILIAVAVVDRKLNGPKQKPPARAGRR